MSSFDTPVQSAMTTAVETIGPQDSVREADREMAKYNVSALPVVDDRARLVGILTRTDLLRLGRARRSIAPGETVLALPETSVAEHMQSTVEVVTGDTPLREAARRMLRHDIHRLCVVEDGRLVGIVSTKEMIRAVAKAGVTTPIAELMRHAPVIVQASDRLSLAIDRMVSAHVSELVVLEGGLPVGTLNQENALAAQDAPPEERTDDWMDVQILSVPMALPTHRAAAQTLATHARALLVVDPQGVRGIVTGMDFTRLVGA